MITIKAFVLGDKASIKGVALTDMKGNFFKFLGKFEDLTENRLIE